MHIFVHNVSMPFTLAHAAAALPFRRLRLVPSALIVGTFAPDFEYFLCLTPGVGFGHTLRGTFALTLPLAMLVLWIFHALVKVPVTRLLPNTIQCRVVTHLDRFRFFGPIRFMLIVGSVLLGIATHLLWDSFTHPSTWLYNHWTFLSQMVRLPIVGSVAYYKVFQHSSTIIGIGILLVWLVRWYHATRPGSQALERSLSPAKKLGIVCFVFALASLGAVVLAIAVDGMPTGILTFKVFVGRVLVAAIALTWWLFVAYGLFYRYMHRQIPMLIS